jgi:deazaflavin-dependent oxidoreductase (nitroreductase family)
VTATDFNQRNIDRFHAQKGRGIDPWGDNLLLLTSRAARSGAEITTPLVHRRKGDDIIVVASKGGAPDHPGWYGNIQANPEVEVEVAAGDGIEKFKAEARAVPDGDERDSLYTYMVEVWPAFADYEKKTDRKIPIVVIKPRGL